MGLAVAGLIVVVLWLANRTNAVAGAPMPGNDPMLGMMGGIVEPQALGPNMNLPSQGATSVFSPALTGGSPLIARDNRTRLNTSYVNTRQRRQFAVVQDAPLGSQTGILGNLTDASASGSFAKEHPQPLTTRPPIYAAHPANKLQRYKF